MNILPTSPHQTLTDKDIEQYFNDMKRWNYDVSYNAFYAFPLKDVLGKYKKSYENFAKKSASEGFRSCVQIQSTVGNLQDVSIENAQHFLDNTTHVYEHFAGSGKNYFFGSFAAPGWLEYLKKIAKTFRELGFTWVVFEEPMYHVDVPGTNDKFFELFKKTYPDLTYPTKQMPCFEYFKIQELKQKVLSGFYDELTAYSKEIGFEKVGIMPWFFSPTFENTPLETWSSSCDTAKITYLKNLDFVIIRMQPDNIMMEAMIASSGESLPRLAYTEALAHSLGKPTIMVNNPTNEHTPPGMDNIYLVPLDYFKKYTLSAFAAAPSGMSRHWYGKNYGQDLERMELLAEVNKYMGRLGTVASPIGFLFSTRAQTKILPRSWKDIWRIYWNFASELQFREKMPFITLFSERLKECLENHPEIKIIILSEYFPAPPHEIELLKKWVSEAKDRVLVYIGSRNGYRYDEKPEYFSFDWKPSELLSILDADITKPVEQHAEDDAVEIRFTGSDYEDAFLNKKAVIECAGFGIPQLKKSCESEWKILYKTVPGDFPVIRRKRIKGGGTLLFCGISMDSPRFAFPVKDLIDYALLKTKTRGRDFPLIKKSSKGVLYSQTSQNYVAVSNINNSEGHFEISKYDSSLWDVKKSTLISPPLKIKIAPLDFHVYRLIDEGYSVLDVEGMVFLSDISEQKNSAVIKGSAGREITLKTALRPKEICANGAKIDFEAKKKKEWFLTKIDGLECGDITLEIWF